MVGFVSVGGAAGAVPGEVPGLLLDGPLTVMVAVVPVGVVDRPGVVLGLEVGADLVPGVDPVEEPPNAASREASMASIAPALPLLS